ncbi:MAG: DUF2914 domain-containing protein [Nitrospiria bacterium]
MWKRTLIWVGLIVGFITGGPLLNVYAEENHFLEVKVLEGHLASYSGHLISFNGKHSMPVFENDAGKIFAVTRLEKVSGYTQIKYLWFFKDHIIHDATLPLRANQMQALSGLNLKPKWTGNWRVDVTSADGTLLYSIPFIVHQKPETLQISSATPIIPNTPNVEANPSPVLTSTESTTIP